MDSFSPEVLLALQALLSKELASRGVAPSVKEASVAPPKKAAKVSKEAKEATAKRAPGAWAAWTKHAPLAHATEYAEFKASNVGAVGIAPLFCTQWRSAHAEEYAAFELAHKASAASSPASAAAPASVAAPASAPAAASPAKEGRKWSEEAKAKAALKRAATKATKALTAKESAVSAAAPAPLPSAPPSAPVSTSNPFDDEDEEAEVELLPFKLGGRNYMRPGVSRLGAEPIWATGDLWEAKADGTRGDWAGVLEEDGSINLDAEEPSIF